ncbi:MAG: hypothetical protein N2169_07890, partial [bacterium]|nr:hypothetical protein [bacterium]
NEYAWGIPNYTIATGISNGGQPNEGASNSANIVFGNQPAVQGPMRSGCFASTGTNRIQAGASYYGVMDLSGNLWELTYSVGVSSQRNFDGQRHGDGLLNAAGDHNVTGWINGAGYRGGSWANTTTQTLCQVSDRFYSAWNDWTSRYSSSGMRLGRTAN